MAKLQKGVIYNICQMLYYMHLPFYTAIPPLEIYPTDNTGKIGKLHFTVAQPRLK